MTVTHSLQPRSAHAVYYRVSDDSGMSGFARRAFMVVELGWCDGAIGLTTRGRRADRAGEGRGAGPRLIRLRLCRDGAGSLHPSASQNEFVPAPVLAPTRTAGSCAPTLRAVRSRSTAPSTERALFGPGDGRTSRRLQALIFSADTGAIMERAGREVTSAWRHAGTCRLAPLVEPALLRHGVLTVHTQHSLWAAFVNQLAVCITHMLSPQPAAEADTGRRWWPRTECLCLSGRASARARSCVPPACAHRGGHAARLRDPNLDPERENVHEAPDRTSPGNEQPRLPRSDSGPGDDRREPRASWSSRATVRRGFLLPGISTRLARRSGRVATPISAPLSLRRIACQGSATRSGSTIPSPSAAAGISSVRSAPPAVALSRGVTPLCVKHSRGVAARVFSRPGPWRRTGPPEVDVVFVTVALHADLFR